MTKLISVILAAGQSKRMKSAKSKVLHSILGKNILEYVLNIANSIGSNKTIIITNRNNDIQIKNTIKNFQFETAIQNPPLGTGHAVMQAEKFLTDYEDTLILCGDVPLLKTETMQKFLSQYQQTKSYASILTAVIDEPTGYGRIVKDKNGLVISIIEEKDASEEIKKIKEINSGIYLFKTKYLVDSLHKISNNNAQNEYYLTDIIKIFHQLGYPITSYSVKNATEIMGINNRKQLAEAIKVMQNRINNNFMLNGVTMIDPNSTFIDIDVKIGKDTTIYPFVVIEGNSEIGENVVIPPNSHIRNKIIKNERE